MFVTDKLVFVELHKTGCTHIGKLLSQQLNGQQVGKHNEPTPDLFTGEHKFLGSIRNPWEWYVSLWAYGCDKKGAVYHFVTAEKGLRGHGWRTEPVRALKRYINDLYRKPGRWKHSYANVDDPSGFRNWLYMMNDRKTFNDIRQGFGDTKLSQFAGLLTYRYMKLFCRNTATPEFSSIASYEDLIAFEKQNCYIDYFIRNEQLEEDLIMALDSCGHEVSVQEINRIESAGKSNTSSRKHEAAYYYDNDAMQLVYEREKLIIDKFDYLPPDLTGTISAV
jgi:hypothetical protein